jgi:hypothetical protein
MDRNATRDAGVGEDSGELAAGGLVESDVGDDAVAEESGFAAFGAVEELVGNKEFPRPEVFLKGAYGAYGDNPFDAEKLHGVDVGAEVELARRNAVTARVTREKGYALPFHRANDEGVGGISKGCLDTNFANVFQAIHAV